MKKIILILLVFIGLQSQAQKAAIIVPPLPPGAPIPPAPPGTKFVVVKPGTAHHAHHYRRGYYYKNGKYYRIRKHR